MTKQVTILRVLRLRKDVETSSPANKDFVSMMSPRRRVLPQPKNAQNLYGHLFCLINWSLGGRDTALPNQCRLGLTQSGAEAPGHRIPPGDCQDS